jgi:hypothetical protein
VQGFVAYPDGDFFSLGNVSLGGAVIRPR